METQFYWDEFIEDLNNTISDEQIVFDAGAGAGHWRKHITRDVKYISMDLGVGDNSVDYSHLDIKGDLRNIPLDNNSVDIIICIQVLEHVPEPWTVLKEFNRILKQGGYLFLTCPQGVPLHQEPYDFYRYTKHGLQYLFSTSGFSVIWMKPQKGNFSKIANDLRMSGYELLNNNHKTKGYFLKLLARIVEKTFKKNDSYFFSDTTGYFIKAKK
ncbi:MAG: class I SAM-dependent methyltransferase [Bacteroidetes bacterium]|nr:class I SAM-dependent methyltransferase [Bacteroidota bacterium]MBS1591530.1 class I SAM-dependent methyltransferase [Bacteroidota bacterium]MBS1670868.1 class I SAM-dependent methyltransferase [Bacteroidota bacterium]